MVMDANLILHGEYSTSGLIDCDQSDAVAISETVNADGNGVVDVKKTGLANPMCAVLVLTEEADSDAYDDEATITIEESDALDRNWQTVVTFPVLHSHIRRVFVTSTVAFVAADVTGALTAQGGDTGQLLYFDPALAGTVGNQGWLYIEMDDNADLFDDAVGQTMNGATTGESVLAAPPDGGSRMESGVSVQMQPGTYIRKFHTNKRYVRCNCESLEDNIGKIWIYLTNAHPSYNTPLGC